MDRGIAIYRRMCDVVRNHEEHVFYQTHTWYGREITEGIMCNDKYQKIDLGDVIGKNILDLGCATGAVSFWAIENGAKRVIGIDKELKNIQIFNELAECIFDKDVFGIQCDLSISDPKEIFELNIDTVFCFAILQYIGYRKIWKNIKSVNVVYVVGGADSNFSEERLSDEDFTAEFLGYVQNNAQDTNKRRQMFRLVRNGI